MSPGRWLVLLDTPSQMKALSQDSALVVCASHILKELVNFE